MSNVETRPLEQTVCDGPPASTGTDTDAPDTELLEPREVPLGGPRAMLVRRSLPNRHRRMVGAWCFADSFGPTDIAGADGMQVPPHPHIGLQTVSWLLEGEVWHQDSLGSRRMVRPGQLNLMTAGAGIAHSEQSPPGHSDTLYGVQLWIAQPEQDRNGPAHFDHHTDLPTLVEEAGHVTVLMGELAGAASPARAYTPLVGADVELRPGGRLRLPLEADFEHAVLALGDPLTADGRAVTAGAMRYLGRGRREVLLESPTATRALLVGGLPFEEHLVMWWNFVGRTHEDIERAREDWMAGRRFGKVTGYDGDSLPAPALPNVPLKPRGRTR
ncbi:pirin family protein [Streptomyces oceani]|uniref:Pirin n=1 Tax=Streptomyces oceani TaxID=1075402 RepID=A0A1E7KL26_9ACTN|nr:pirin family protein [Streptomyces oceani]OEV04531.1 pirin [Streptomyces oceani]